jgi:subtilisin-like proprotein convertase family protein
MDLDGCSDWEEVWPGEDTYITDPNDEDTDNDGLTDCNEYYTKAFKSTKRYRIPDYEESGAIIGSVEVSLHSVKSSVDSSKIMMAEARVGISHNYIGNLKLQIGNGLRIITVRELSGGSADDIFDDYDLVEHGFPATDFDSARTWTLTVEDHVAGFEGFIEYFEIHILGRTAPSGEDSDDSDQDGISDSEEVVLGADGWITDPWRDDTDGDTWSDSYEINTKGTDPTRRDTDRDGVDDNDDMDPLHDLMIKLHLKTIEALGDNDMESMFFHVIVEESELDFWTEHVDNGGWYNEYDRIYTFDIEDDLQKVHIKLFLWENSWGGDDVWDFIPQDGANGIKVGYYVLWGEKDYEYDESDDGDVGDHSARITFSISTVRPSRINTVLLNATDAEQLYLTPGGKWRYTGEDEYVLVLFYYAPILPGDINPLLIPGTYNAVIVPRHVFRNSTLNSEMEYVYENCDYENEDELKACLPLYLQGLSFGSYDNEADTTTGSINGVFDGTVINGNAIINSLINDNDGKVIAQARVVTDQLATMNLEDDLLQHIPILVRFDNIGDDPDGSWWEAGTEWLGENLGKIIKGLGVVLIIGGILTGNPLLIGLGIICVEYGEEIAQALIAAFEFIVDAIVFIVKMLIKFIEWLINKIVDAIMKYVLEPIFDFLADAFNKFVDAISDVMQLAANDYGQNGEVSDNTVGKFDSALTGKLFWIIMIISAAIIAILYYFSPYITFLGLVSILAYLVGDLVCGFVLEAIGFDRRGLPDKAGGPKISSSASIGDTFKVIKPFIATDDENEEIFDYSKQLFDTQKSEFMYISEAVGRRDKTGTAYAVSSALMSTFGLALIIKGLDMNPNSNELLDIGMIFSALGARAGATTLMNGVPALRIFAAVTMALGGGGFVLGMTG